MMGLIEDGDLFAIYGAVSSETAKAQRNRVIGFLQVARRAIRDTDKASTEGLRRKVENGWNDRWTHAIPVVRAWRATEAVLLERIAPTTYRPEAGQAIAVWNPPLLPSEVALALKVRVREVNVFGEAPVSSDLPPSLPLSEVFYPSRAFKGSFGERTSTYEDGPTLLYLARFEGDGHGLLGKKQPMFDTSVLMKIGVSNDVTRRCAELNGGFPPAAIGRWTMPLVSEVFPDRASAEAAEQVFKETAVPQLKSLGGEFFHGEWAAAELLFATVPGVSRFGKR